MVALSTLKSPTDYTPVTEVVGTGITCEAMQMSYTRYAFAADYCKGKRVLEVACGVGQGLGLLAEDAKLVVGADYTDSMLRAAAQQYRHRVPLVRLDAHYLPFANASFDVVVFYEAIYYLGSPDEFLAECRRVLSHDGVLLIATANCERPGFNPSPFSHTYFSARQLEQRLRAHGFEAQLYGGFPEAPTTAVQSLVSHIRRLAIHMHLIPRTMKGKKLLKWMFYGKLAKAPAELKRGDAVRAELFPIQVAKAAEYKVLYATAVPRGNYRVCC